jgi:hypothetical protein
LKENDADEDDDGGTLGFLDFGGGGGGGTGESLGEGGMAGFSDEGICNTHQASLSAAAPNASPSSFSSIIVGGLLAILLICSAVALNLFSMSFSTSFHCYFIQLVKLSFSFWYCLSLFLSGPGSRKGFSLVVLL